MIRQVPFFVVVLALAAAAEAKPKRAPWKDFAPAAELTGHTNLVRSVAFSPDGTTLVTGGADRALRLWDTRTGKRKGAHLMPKSG